MYEDYACTDCSERGRPKAGMGLGGYYCHDEEKSCYFYTLQGLNQRIG